MTQTFVRRYEVKRGDNFSNIVKKNGLNPRDWRRIYNAPYNSAIRKTRPDPNVILPGDVIYLPTMRQEEIAEAERRVVNSTTLLQDLRKQVAAVKKELVHAQRQASGRMAPDRQRLERLVRRLEGVEQVSDDAAEECDDAESCMGGGGASAFYNYKASRLRKEINQLRRDLQARNDRVENRLDKIGREIANLEREEQRSSKQLEKSRAHLKKLTKNLYPR